jgi:hypothetical protein
MLSLSCFGAVSIRAQGTSTKQEGTYVVGKKATDKKGLSRDSVPVYIYSFVLHSPLRSILFLRVLVHSYSIGSKDPSSPL